MPETFSKQERVCGKVAVTTLLQKGRWGVCGPLKFCCLPTEGAECSRIMVSVPKKFFKRAVKRNLLKRRIRESYRTQKALLEDTRFDILIYYNTKEVLDSQTIRAAVAEVLGQVRSRA